ncbi:MAG: hypothetical protein ACE5JK_03260, partial [Candidatus Omnitrophota bacterium]
LEAIGREKNKIISYIEKTEDSEEDLIRKLEAMIETYGDRGFVEMDETVARLLFSILDTRRHGSVWRLWPDIFLIKDDNRFQDKLEEHLVRFHSMPPEIALEVAEEALIIRRTYLRSLPPKLRLSGQIDAFPEALFTPLITYFIGDLKSKLGLKDQDQGEPQKKHDLKIAKELLDIMIGARDKALDQQELFETALCIEDNIGYQTALLSYILYLSQITTRDEVDALIRLADEIRQDYKKAESHWREQLQRGETGPLITYFINRLKEMLEPEKKKANLEKNLNRVRKLLDLMKGALTGSSAYANSEQLRNILLHSKDFDRFKPLFELQLASIFSEQKWTDDESEWATYKLWAFRQDFLRKAPIPPNEEAMDHMVHYIINRLLEIERGITEELKSTKDIFHEIIDMKIAGDHAYLIVERQDLNATKTGDDPFNRYHLRLFRLNLKTGEIDCLGKPSRVFGRPAELRGNLFYGLESLQQLDWEDRWKERREKEFSIAYGEGSLHLLSRTDIFWFDNEGNWKSVIRDGAIADAYSDGKHLFVVEMTKETASADQPGEARIIRIDKDGNKEVIFQLQGHCLENIAVMGEEFENDVSGHFIFTRLIDPSRAARRRDLPEGERYWETIIFNANTGKVSQIAGYYWGTRNETGSIIDNTAFSYDTTFQKVNIVPSVPLLLRKTPKLRANIEQFRTYSSLMEKIIPELNENEMSKMISSLQAEEGWMPAFLFLRRGVVNYKTVEKLKDVFDGIIAESKSAREIRQHFSFINFVLERVEDKELAIRVIERWGKVFFKNKELADIIAEKMKQTYQVESMPPKVIFDIYANFPDKLHKLPQDALLYLKFLTTDELTAPSIIKPKKFKGRPFTESIQSRDLSALIRLSQLFPKEEAEQGIDWKEDVISGILKIEDSELKGLQREIAGAVNGQDKTHLYWIRELVQNSRDAIRGMLGIKVRSGFIGHGFYTVFAGKCAEVRIRTGNGKEAYELILKPTYDAKDDLVSVRVEKMHRYRSSYKGTQIQRVNYYENQADEEAIIGMLYASSQAKRFLGAVPSKGDDGVPILLNGDPINEDGYEHDDTGPVVNITNGMTAQPNETGHYEWMVSVEDPVGMDLFEVLYKLLPPDVTDDDKLAQERLDTAEISRKLKSSFSKEKIGRSNVDRLYVDGLERKYTHLVPKSVLDVLTARGWNIEFPAGTPVPRTRNGVMEAEKYAPWIAVLAMKTLIELYLTDPEVKIFGLPKDYVYSNSNALNLSRVVPDDISAINKGMPHLVNFKIYKDNPQLLVQLLTGIKVEIDGEETCLGAIKNRALEEYEKKRAGEVSLEGVLPAGMKGQRKRAEKYIKERVVAKRVDAGKIIFDEPIIEVFIRFFNELNKLTEINNSCYFNCIYGKGNYGEAFAHNIYWNLCSHDLILKPFLEFLATGEADEAFAVFTQEFIHESAHTLEYESEDEERWTHQTEGGFAEIMKMLLMRMARNFETNEVLRKRVLKASGYTHEELQASYESVIRKIAEARSRPTDTTDENVTCGTICESGHKGSHKALNEQLKRFYETLGKEAGRKRDFKKRPLTSDEVIRDLEKTGRIDSQTAGLLQEIKAHIEEKIPVQILFAIPENNNKLWWVGEDYAGGHFNKTRIHISLPLILAQDDPEKAAWAIAKHDFSHIKGEGHKENDEGMRIVKKVAMAEMIEKLAEDTLTTRDAGKFYDLMLAINIIVVELKATDISEEIDFAAILKALKACCDHSEKLSENDKKFNGAQIMAQFNYTRIKNLAEGKAEKDEEPEEVAQEKEKDTEMEALDKLVRQYREKYDDYVPKEEGEKYRLRTEILDKTREVLERLGRMEVSAFNAILKKHKDLSPAQLKMAARNLFTDYVFEKPGLGELLVVILEKVAGIRKINFRFELSKRKEEFPGGGNIAAGLQGKREYEWLREIKEKSDEVREANEDIVRVAEKRCKKLLSKKRTAIKIVLQLHDIPLFFIEMVLQPLEDPRNSFMWSEARERVRARETYMLGNRKALAVDVIRFLLEREKETGIDDLVDEYILHEALHRIISDHHAAIDLTTIIFKRGIVGFTFKRPRETPLGKALRDFINAQVPPPAGPEGYQLGDILRLDDEIKDLMIFATRNSFVQTDREKVPVKRIAVKFRQIAGILEQWGREREEYGEIAKLIKAKAEELEGKYLDAYYTEMKRSGDILEKPQTDALFKHVLNFNKNIGAQINNSLIGYIHLSEAYELFKEIRGKITSFNELLNLIHVFLMEEQWMMPSWARTTGENELASRIGKICNSDHLKSLGITVDSKLISIIPIKEKEVYVQIRDVGHALSLDIEEVEDGRFMIRYKSPKTSSEVTGTKGLESSGQNRSFPGYFARGRFEVPGEALEQELEYLIRGVAAAAATAKPAAEPAEPAELTREEEKPLYKENNDERHLLAQTAKQLGRHPVNMRIDLSAIPGAEGQLEKNMETLARLIAWHNTFGLNIKYILEHDTGGKALAILKDK